MYDCQGKVTMRDGSMNEKTEKGRRHGTRYKRSEEGKRDRRDGRRKEGKEGEFEKGKGREEEGCRKDGRRNKHWRWK
jgi:hypothetical protein